MKRRIVLMILVTLIVAQLASAQNAEYATLYAKAQQYEADKNWFYALCTYYDAMQTDPGEAQNAAERFTAIRDAINSGKPGLGTYTASSLHAGWLMLLQSAEKYWTANSPYEYTFGELSKGAIDYTKKTYTYTAKVSCILSQKYGAVMGGAVAGGLIRAWNDGWSDIPERWPDTSVYKASDADGSYMQNGAALSQCRSNTYPAWNLVSNRTAAYQLQCTLCGEDGVALAVSSKTAPMSGTFTIGGITQQTSDQIESGRVYMKLTGLYLTSGVYNSEEDSFARGYKRYSIPITTVMTYRSEKDRVRAYAAGDIFNRVERGRALKQINAYIPIAVDGMNFVRGGLLVHGDGTQTVIDNFYVDNGSLHEYQNTQSELDNMNKKEGLSVYYADVSDTKDDGKYRLPTDDERLYMEQCGSGGCYVRTASAVTVASEKAHAEYPWVTGMTAAESCIDLNDGKTVSITVSGHALNAPGVQLALGDDRNNIRNFTSTSPDSVTVEFVIPQFECIEDITLFLNDQITGYKVSVRITDRVEERRLAEEEQRNKEISLKQEEQEKKRLEEERAEENARQMELEKQRVEEEVKQQRHEAREARRAAFKKDQVGRNALIEDIGYMNSSLYTGMDYDTKLYLGYKNVFLGAEVNVIPVKIKPEYLSTQTSGSFFGASLLFGSSITLGIVRPYIECGGGVFYTNKSDEDSTDDLFGWDAQFVGGFDLLMKNFGLGCFYKLKYFFGAGWSDCYGGSIEILF